MSKLFIGHLCQVEAKLVLDFEPQSSDQLANRGQQLCKVHGFQLPQYEHGDRLAAYVRNIARIQHRFASVSASNPTRVADERISQTPEVTVPDKEYLAQTSEYPGRTPCGHTLPEAPSVADKRVRPRQLQILFGATAENPIDAGDRSVQIIRNTRQQLEPPCVATIQQSNVRHVLPLRHSLRRALCGF
ncbi:hypothetical protein LJR168_000457 [Pseudoxanthomonas sp. LjRoot168]|uniref:hypothetical protein n=1 Tax=unclassified Pseudoxanthomonas TaxID=2645906 RepID=UPI003ECD1080